MILKIKSVKHQLILFLAVFAVLTLIVTPSIAQSPLTIEEIMKGKDFVGHWPSDPQWSEDGKTIYFNWNPQNNPADSLYKFILGTNSPVKVYPEERKRLPSFSAVYNTDMSKKVYESDGDLYLTNVKNGKITRITNTIPREYSPYFHGENIHFISDNNLFSWESETGILSQLTDFKATSAPEQKEETEQDRWLREDQKRLSTVIKERQEKKALQKQIKEAYETEKPKTIYINGKSIRNIKMSPQGDLIAFILYKEPKNKNTMVPEFVSETGYTIPENARPKVGSGMIDSEVWLYKLSTDTTYSVKTNDLPGIKDLPEYYKDYPERQGKDPEVREVYSYGPFWSEDGNYAIMLYRSKDNKDRWITLLDPNTGTNTLLDRQRDEAWIGGPGLGWGSYSAGEVGWMPDNKSIWFQSEESGYSHLYTIDVTSGAKKVLTSGSFEIYNPRISKNKKY